MSIIKQRPSCSSIRNLFAQNICEVAELGKEKYPEVCNRLLEEGLAVSVKYASILTPECKQKLDAFEDGIEAAAYGNSAREYKQLYQHYKYATAQVRASTKRRYALVEACWSHFVVLQILAACRSPSPCSMLYGRRR